MHHLVRESERKQEGAIPCFNEREREREREMKCGVYQSIRK